MPRFHFNVCDGVRSPDEDGIQLDGLRQARMEAVSFFGQMLHERPEGFWNDPDVRVEVTDAQGMVLFTLQLLATDAAAVGG